MLERIVLPPEKAAEFGQMFFDLVSAHCDLSREIRVGLRLMAADEVMRLCEMYRGDEALDKAVRHYAALRGQNHAPTD